MLAVIWFSCASSPDNTIGAGQPPSAPSARACSCGARRWLRERMRGRDAERQRETESWRESLGESLREERQCFRTGKQQPALSLQSHLGHRLRSHTLQHQRDVLANLRDLGLRVVLLEDPLLGQPCDGPRWRERERDESRDGSRVLERWAERILAAWQRVGGPGGTNKSSREGGGGAGPEAAAAAVPTQQQQPQRKPGTPTMRTRGHVVVCPRGTWTGAPGGAGSGAGRRASIAGANVAAARSDELDQSCVAMVVAMMTGCSF